jgi:hypothetical protein
MEEEKQAALLQIQQLQKQLDEEKKKQTPTAPPKDFRKDLKEKEVIFTKQLATQLLILERHVKFKGQKSSFKQIREVWIKRLKESDTFAGLGAYIADLDNTVSSSAQTKEWKKVRDEWRRRSSNLESLPDVIWLFTEFENGLTKSYKESSWLKANCEPWKKALAFIEKLYNSTEPDKSKARQVIAESIAQGAVLFNSGHQELCEKLYFHCVQHLLYYNLSPDVQKILEDAIEKGQQAKTDTDRAWLYRRTIDTVTATLKN